MKKAASLLLSLLIVFQPSEALSASELQNIDRPQHIVFLVHGINGTEKHFYHTAKALEVTLNRKDPKTRYEVMSLNYETGHNDKTAYDFAYDLQQSIQIILKEKNFQNQDKISFVAHSQGGLIGLIWLFQSLMGTSGFSDPALIKQVDAFVALGSPFWGAKTAKWASEIKQVMKRLKLNVPHSYGEKELDQMAFGSDMIFDFRNVMLDPVYEPYIQQLKAKVRFLNVAGVADLLNPLGIFVSGTPKYEDDGAVPLSSARFNFIAQKTLKETYRNDDYAGSESAHEIEMAPYIAVNAMHRSPFPALPNFAGLSQMPEDCIEDENCLHPVFSSLWKHLLGHELNSKTENLGPFSSFLLDLNVRIENGKSYSCEDISIDFLAPDGELIKNTNLDLARFFELYASGWRKSEKYPDHCRFYFTGSVRDISKVPEEGESLLIRVGGSSLKTRYIETRIRPTYSTFIDLNLLVASSEK